MGSKPSIVIYDRNMKKLAMLENAFGVGYKQNLNLLWTGHFSLPYDDPKNEYCQPLHLVEIFDGDERVELFRILPITLQKTEYGVVTYELEHVLATLIDDVMFQYHQIGGLGVYTREVIEYVLSHQITQNWVLGECDFGRQFQYKWENENLLGSIFSIPKTFDEKYIFTFDTRSYPWTVNLKRINMNAIPKSYIRYGVNQRSIERIIDPTDLCTRIYGLGYGEGINQLTISEINGGLPYIDSDTVGQFGVISRILVDRRYEDAASLKGRMESYLENAKVPKLTYIAEGADLHPIKRDPYGNFRVGDIIVVIDDEINVNMKSVIVSVEKTDITVNPANVTVTIANKPQELSQSMAMLADRQRIGDVYAQGATNIDSYNFADNCDQNYPAVIKFYIPEETVRINKLLLSYEVSNFRAYSKAIEGGGELATSTQNGGAYATTTASGGGVYDSTESGGRAVITSEEGGGDYVTSEIERTFPGTSLMGTTVSGDPPHSHGIATPHGHYVNVPNHDHDVDIPNHRHNFETPNHTHDFSIPNHDHDLSIPDHTHGIEHGIFLASVMPSSVVVMVDGNIVGGIGLNESAIDIVPYLEKDGAGKIIRGTWHEISLTPNRLGRIVADVTSQFFIQSRGGYEDA